MAPRIYMGEGPEDDPESRGEELEDDPVVDMLAWNAMQEAFGRLRTRATQGDPWAIDRLAEFAADLAEVFNPTDLSAALAEKARISQNWPAVIPADARQREELLEKIDKLRLGAKGLLRVYRGGKGRPPEEHREGSPSYVGKLLIYRLEGIRRELAMSSLKGRLLLVRCYDIPFLRKVSALPDFNRKSLDQWTELAIELAKDPRHRADFIPPAWDAEAGGGKGRGALAKRKITDGMQAVVPD